MESMIKIENATFRYGKRTIFSDLNLDLTKGEMLCLLGANGCGKTTLLRCLSGSLKLDQGRVWLGGEDIKSLSPTVVARRMGIVFQEHSAPFPYTVLDVVRMGRAPHLGLFGRPSKKDTEIAESAIETVGIAHLKEQRYTQISGGERQLTLIARTLTQEPEIILLDEPTSHLDFKNQAIVLRIINRLAGDGLTVIMTSHFPNHALLYSCRVAMMNDGRFLITGDSEEVITEENLKATYDMNVRILSVKDRRNGGQTRFCIPALDVVRDFNSMLSDEEYLLVKKA